jgi:exo-1,4-beta-D-glucosaminidase
MHHFLATLLLGSGFLASAATANPLTSGAGEKAAIPNWDFQSTSEVDKDLEKLSKTGVDTSSWYHVDVSRCTLMGCLLESGVYKDSDLWFSDNLNKFNWGQFLVPWVYRNEFALPAKKDGQHFLLETNGISSKADLYVNGEQVADSEFQAGSYGGHTYDITSLAAEENALLVRVYPTQYLYDFAVGFVDWNPYSPDNGTGVWRDINIKQTGPVSMGPLSVTVTLGFPIDQAHATVTVRTTAQNLEDHEVTATAKTAIMDPSGSQVGTGDQSITLGPRQSKVVEFEQIVESPQIWWPKAWGGQPLYKAKVDFSVDSDLSDTAESSFGIRTVTSLVNTFNDTIFNINGNAFQVLGGGYSADMFLRWDPEYFTRIAQYMLDMGLNTIRLEGKNEHAELYEIADRLGLMVIAGWECCDKWESWEYNHDLAIDPPAIWDERDYAIANASMIHEAALQQTHPSVMAYLIGSDYWPNDRATKMYVDALKAAGWQVPILASASKRGYPDLLGPSGMKMSGPYDWIPPNYWYDVNPAEDRYGAAFGFGSELGAGVGTPELGSLKKFLTEEDMQDLWTKPNKGLFHMSNNVSQFYDREIYNDGLYKRFGEPKSLDDYLMKAQLTDYEATRAQHEAFSARWSAGRPATGTVYWMLNNAWPSLHWNQFDHYLRPAGSYFGTKTGSRFEHVAYDYFGQGIWLINHSLDRIGERTIEVELMDLEGNVLSTQTVLDSTKPNISRKIAKVEGLDQIKNVAFLRLKLSRGDKVISRNVYWLGTQIDELQWDNSTWYYTPVTSYVDYTALSDMKAADVSVTVSDAKCQPHTPDVKAKKVVLENNSDIPAFFVSLNLVDRDGADVVPVLWSDNYVTLWPYEKLSLTVGQWDEKAVAVEIKGVNVKADTTKI